MSPYWKLYRGERSPRALPSTRSAGRRARLALSLALAVCSLPSAGCTVVHNGYSALTRNNSWNDTVVVLRNRSHSSRAWHRRKQHFCNEKHSADFCKGFRAGYEAIAGGSDGCTPAFPPSEYWSWEYQSGEGQARTSAWFTGYPYGVRAAEEDGAGNWHQLQMSPQMKSQLLNTAAPMPMGSAHPLPAPQPYEVPAVPTDMPVVPGVPGAVPMAEPYLIGPSPSDPGFGLPSPGVVPQFP